MNLIIINRMQWSIKRRKSIRREIRFLNRFLAKIADRSEEIMKNNNLVDEEATRNMLAQIEEGCESMSRAMEDDKARQ